MVSDIRLMGKEMPGNPAPWEMQSGEKSHQFHAFTIYRNLGPAKRSFSEVVKALQAEGINVQSSYTNTLARWSTKHHWVARAAAFDRYNDSLMLARVDEHVRKMADQHVGYIETVMGIVGHRLNLAIDRNEWQDMRLEDAIRLAIDWIKLDRLVHGQPTENIRQETTGSMKVSADIDISRFSTDAAFQALVSAYLEKAEQNNQEITRD